MAEDRTDDLIGRRLALYAYLEPLLTGRRVLEISSGIGRGAAHEQSTQYLRSLGARVVSVDRDASVQVDDRFDVVVIPEAEELARRTGAFAALRKLLVDGGRVIVAAANVERGGEGVGYYDLHGAVAAHFAHVQMFGVTPFVGMGIVEFEGAVDGLRIDSRLVKEGSEPPALYVAVAGTQVAPGARLRAGPASVRADRDAAGRRRWRRAGARQRVAARGDRRAARAPAPRRRGPRGARRRGDHAASRARGGGRVGREPDAQDDRGDVGDGGPPRGGTAWAGRHAAARARRPTSPRRATRPIACARSWPRPKRAPAPPSCAWKRWAAPLASGRASWKMRSNACGWPTASWRARVATPPASSRRRARRPPARRRSRNATRRSRRATNGSRASRAKSRISSGGSRSWRTS